MKLKKQIVEGWVAGNSKRLVWGPSDSGRLWLQDVWVVRGDKERWSKDAWPPRKVRVTVEEIE